MSLLSGKCYSSDRRMRKSWRNKLRARSRGQNVSNQGICWFGGHDPTAVSPADSSRKSLIARSLEVTSRPEITQKTWKTAWRKQAYKVLRNCTCDNFSYLTFKFCATQLFFEKILSKSLLQSVWSLIKLTEISTTT